MAEDKVDIRISSALDPETYRAVSGYSDETRGYVDDVVGAFNDAYVTIGKIHSARELWEGNPAVTPENRIIIVGKQADKQKDRVLTRLARAERDLRARIDQVEDELSKPLTERAGQGTLNGEVRAYARGLERPKRHKLIMDALEGGDRPTLEALLGAQPFLSGLTPEDRDHYVRLYHERNNPNLVIRLDLMKRFLDMVERNGPLIHPQFAKAVGAKPAQVSALSAANERALAALKIEPTQ